ncbi:DUF3320 domain-containing protein [Asticcacaulis sp. AC402]|uniref:DUF3320 domain-containing protein n=1 Tax=Asticcacaulis sp. AC402 TaxID=1282361 RepID=UPI0003C3FF89|nr:DUF3320 domain-containing protein [Asticcacaulis sp. AC402]ESQ73592.1 DNA helicase [Asticcacaulis sp. AC402]
MADADTPASLRDRLLKERHALLDLSTRNRLLNVPLRLTQSRTVEIVDELSPEVFRILTQGKAMTFLPGAQPGVDDQKGSTDTGLAQPSEEGPDVKATRHTDTRLQTRLTSEALQKRLFDVWYDAQTLEQEQGVNILYLALGLLRWYDADDSDIVRHAPLVLLPVQLERGSAAEKFKLKDRDEPPSPNLTLQAKMKSEFGLTIEDFPDEDELDLAAYFATVADTVAGQKRWEVLPDAMVLGFFSFAKFLMYRDLDPDTWVEKGGPEDDALSAHPLIGALLRDGFPQSEPIVPDHAAIDDAIPPEGRYHVVDADSSQTVAIAEAAGGRTLVIKGPPGTGKSQTITNIIAAAAARGKTVLFVAEKMAALDVVHRRLKQVGLGPLTLELHSNKISKRAVLEELKRTREASLLPPRRDPLVDDKLAAATDDLNGFAARLHAPLQPSRLSPQQILGRLIAQSRGVLATGPAFALEGAETWTPDDVAKRRGLAEDITARLATTGPLQDHAWRGVGADPLDPAQTEQVARDITRAQTALGQAIQEAKVAIRLFGAAPPGTVNELERLLAFLQLTPLPRQADRTAFNDDAWRNSRALKQLIETGKTLVDLRHRSNAVFNDIGLTADYTSLRAEVVTQGDGLFRFLDGGYKGQIALLRSYVKDPLPDGVEARLKLIDLAVALQRCEATFAVAQALGRAWGRTWQGADSDWERLDNILRWRTSHTSLPDSVWPKLAALNDADLAEADRARQAIYAATTEHRQALDAAAATLKLDPEALDATVVGRENQYARWLADPEGLNRYIAVAWRGRQLAALGASSLVANLYENSLHDNSHNNCLAATDLVPAFDRAYATVLRDLLFRDWPDLRAFDGDDYERRVARFRQLDHAHIESAKEEIAHAHAEARPRGTAGVGPLGVLNAELAKKRSHLPIRILLERAGPVIQQLKPVFMMSPLSVAQFLKPGALEFDLLVMDEASQIEPVDALGAVARVKQMVVVGDERQLPPTAFFKKLTGEDEAEDDDSVTLQAKDAESILDLCLAKGAPHRMLNWHYRSRHQSLIAVSNREFYENRLYIVPSPYDAVAGMGLKYHRLADTIYERGGSRTNHLEARRVAEAVIAHARDNAHQSLGVAAFSVAQRQAILRELEGLRRAYPQTEDFFATTGTEPFFVKNLENIQGDERDVIFISVGYGKTAEGNLPHAFGPLSGEGGERRLNVLISRAKLRCEVFCNFSGGDIDLERTPARGVAALKLFLTFAETGRFDAGDTAAAGHDSAFEAEVAGRLTQAGYAVHSQIGASGFRVDLAVADPETPGRFVLGIECDGAQYHASRSARDRDRLRQQVLEAHGWIIHRIWSADWYLRPNEELKKLEVAIAAARTSWAARDAEGYRTPQPTPVAPADLTLTIGPVEPLAERQVLYREAGFKVSRATEPTDLPVAHLAETVVRIVEVEGPLHGDEVIARLRDLWALPKLTARLRSAGTAALRCLLADGRAAEDDGFYNVPDRAAVVRDRSEVASAGLRKPDMLPPSEIDAALIQTVTDNYGAGRGQIAVAVSRMLGFATTSPALKARIESRLDLLLAKGTLEDKGELITLATGAEA